MSDNLSNISKSYWNWELVWKVNAQYRELINIDPDAVPYMDKLSLTSFFAKTRKWYVEDKPMEVFASESMLDFKTTDIRKIDNSWCWGWDCYNILYQISHDKARYRIVKKDCWVCGSLTFVEEGYRNICDSESFFDINYPIGSIIKQWTWRQEIEDKIEARFYWDFTPVVDWWTIFVWDYILFYSSIDSFNPWQAWIYRQIKWIFEGYLVLDTWYDETTEVGWIWDNVSYKIFRDVWETVWRVWSDTLNVYHWTSNITTSMGWSWSGSIMSVVNHNWILNVLTDKWYNVYWWIWENIMYFTWIQSTYVWKDKINSVSFGNFLIFLWRSWIDWMTFSEDWKYSYKYSLSDTNYSDFWVFSQNAFSVFDNWLFIVGNDKRLYAVSIAWSWSKYYLELKSQSESIFPELDLLQDGDEVSLSSYQNKLYIFINGRLYSDNEWLDKTKILIFNKDYWLRYKHIVSRWVISWTKYWLFYWDWLFQYIWDRDVYILWTMPDEIIHYSPIKAEIVFDIVNSESHWITNSLWNRVSLMNTKKINWMKLLLGAWIYTDNTYIEIDSYMSWYKFTKKIPFKGNEWFDNWKKYFNWDYDDIVVSPCFKDQLNKNDNMDNPYSGSRNNTDIKEKLVSPVCDYYSEYDIRYDPKRLDDYAICYDDKWYELSPMKHITVNPWLKFDSIMHTVRIVSNNYDMLNFGWAIVEYDSYPVQYKDKSSYDIEISCE